MTPGYFPGNILFLVIFLAANAFFFYSVYKLYKIMLLGKPEDRFGQYGERIKSVLAFVFGQKRVLREPAGIGHFLIFWGFIVITIGSIETFGVGIYHNFSYEPIIGKFLYNILYFIQDIFCAGVLIALAVALYRRFVVKPLRLESDDPKATKLDAVIIISLIAVLILLLFGSRAADAQLYARGEGKYFPPLAIISQVLSLAFSGASVDTLKFWSTFFWWAHTIVILAFLVYIPYSKHLHLLAAIPNVFFRRLGPVGELSKMDLEDEEAESFGIANIEDFTWKQLLDLYACTECGRCAENCPAALTDKPLNPKYVIHHMKEHLKKKGELLLEGQGNGNGEGNVEPQQAGDEAESTPKSELEKSLIGDVVAKDALWSCTTCGNCMENCPVFIEHVHKFVDMRRYLVLTESDFPAEVATVFRNWETNSNPWGIGFSQRGDWAKDLPVKTLSEDSNVEYLLYVGCAGSFDDRGQKVARAVVKLLHEAGVSFGILGVEEKCCGETARRIGNEYLFQMMAADLVETINGYGVKKIIVTCPHGYNCLKNEYPQFGGEWKVYHHSQVLDKLVRDGMLTPTKYLNRNIVFHDSCYLGRYNSVYEQPRNVIKAIPGAVLSEMDRHRHKSFCCGAGGGRMWMEETLGRKKINDERTEQALRCNPDIIGVACPFCTTMFEDGLKAKDMEEDIKVYDIAEILAMSVEFKK